MGPNHEYQQIAKQVTDTWLPQFLEPWHRRCCEYKILIVLFTDNIHDLQKERWLFGKVVVHVGIYGSKAAKGFSAFNVCLVIVKIMTCNKKFPPQIKYKNNDHQTPINVDLTLIQHFCVSWLINLLSSLGGRLALGTQSRCLEEEKWEREEEEWRAEEERKVAEEESGGGGGEKSCEGERRRSGSCITQFQSIFLISLPHFDFWGWACYEMALAFCCLLIIIVQSPKLAAISNPKTIIISLGPFEYLWLLKKKKKISYFSIWVSRKKNSH